MVVLCWAERGEARAGTSTRTVGRTTTNPRGTSREKSIPKRTVARERAVPATVDIRAALLHHNDARHRGAVDGAIVMVAARGIERALGRPGRLDRAACEAWRAGGLDAVVDRPSPGPGDLAADRDRIDRRILARVVDAPEEVVANVHIGGCGQRQHGCVEGHR